MDSLDPYQRPPGAIRNVYKEYQKMKLVDVDKDTGIVDPERDILGNENVKVRVVREIDLQDLQRTFQGFADANVDIPVSPVSVYEHSDMPGLHIIPALLPPEIQTLLLSRLLHRDLSSPSHLTNIHTHYTFDYPPSHASFFSFPPSQTQPIATPKDPAIHKPLSITPLLTKKLRWVTLGGQYDWTLKQYPSTPPPAFPPDIKQLLEGLFPKTKAEAAIVNLYSPGDTLSVHRDVSEMCGTGLISVSLGCEAIFVIGVEEGDSEKESKETKTLVLRLRSGSAVYMSGKSRFAWHGVPQVVSGTCPAYLEDWPGGSGEEGQYEEWRGWMRTKRVNLNVRQMWE